MRYTRTTTQITRDETTAALLTAEANKAGLTVSAYVRSTLLHAESAKIPKKTDEQDGQSHGRESKSLVGCMAEYADELDEAVEYAMNLRKRESSRELGE